MRTFNAAALKIEHLYHYQPYKPEWLEQLLIGGKLYFSNPRNFNPSSRIRPPKMRLWPGVGSISICYCTAILSDHGRKRL